MKHEDGLFWLLLALVAYLPFQVALNLAPDIDLMSGRILILVLALLWLIREVYQKNIKVKEFFMDKISLALLTFLLLSAASIFPAANATWGWRKLLVFISIFPLFWLVRSLASAEKGQRKLLNLVIGGAVLSALIALAQFGSQFIFGQETIMSFWADKITPLFSGASFGALVTANPSWLAEISGQALMRAIGLFPDPHMLSFYLGLIFPFALARLFFEKKNRFFWFMISSLLIVTLLLTFSRGGYLGLLMSLAIFLVLARPRLTPTAKKFLASGFLMALAILLIVGWPVLTRLAASFDLAEGSNLGRLAIWQDSWAIIKSHLVVGVGLGNYSLAVDFNDQYRSAVTSHNFYLDLWAELGIFGLIAWFLIIAAAVQRAWQKRQNTPVLAFASLSALTYFSVHSFFETAIFNPTVLAFLMVVLALMASPKKDVL